MHLAISLNLQEANKPPDSWFELKVNTHVYVTGLPDDVTFDEVICPSCFLTSILWIFDEFCFVSTMHGYENIVSIYPLMIYQFCILSLL